MVDGNALLKLIAPTRRINMHAQTEAASAERQADFGQVTIYPILGYRNLPAAIDWLIRVFSFEPLAVYQNEAGDFVHVELRLGDGVIMPTSLDKGGDPNNPWSQPVTTQGIYVALDELDAYYERAVAEGAEVLRPLADTDYGSREYTARDLEGNLWSFGTYRPRLD
jgi:uncharacterized glyoxalase superfamily protein PhnB